MKKFKKTAFAIASVLCLGFGLPLISSNTAYADAGYTQGASITVENFETTGKVDVPYEITNGTSSAGTVVVTVKNPYGVNIPVSENTFTPSIAGTYSVIYTVAGFSKTLKVDVEDVNEGVKIVYPTNSADIIPAEIGLPEDGEEITIKIPAVTVEDADGNKIEDAVVTVERNGVELAKESGQYVYKLTNDSNLGAHTFEFKYQQGGKVVASLKKTMEVSSTFENDYKFSYEFDSAKPTTAVLGAEKELPTVSGINSKTKDEISVYYTVKAEYEEGSELINVTDTVISVNEDGKYVFTANKAGDYTITYKVVDFKGTEATVSSNSFEISDVKDTQKPEPIVVEPYTTITDDTYVEAEHKLASNVNLTTGKVVLYPIYAKDNANGLVENNLTLKRILKNSDNDEVFNESEITENIAGKLIVFSADLDLADYDDNTDVIDGYKKSQIYVVAEDLTQDVYTVEYIATDKAGKEDSISYSINARTDFAYASEDKPEISFTENLPTAIFFGDKVSFVKPGAKDINTNTNQTSYTDKYMKVEVKYILYAGSSILEQKMADEQDSLLIWNEDTSKYEITIPETKSTATKLEIVASAKNDSGIVGTSTKEIVIVKAGDAMTTNISAVDTTVETDFVQGTEIVLPTVKYNEDMPEYLTLDIEIKHENGTSFTALDAVKKIEDIAGQDYKLVTFSGAKFTATKAGTYTITYTTKDAKNNITLQYFTLVITENASSAEIRMTGLPTSINNGKIELGNTADLAVPTITTSLPHDYQVVLVSGPTGAELSKYKFTPKAVGTYELKYVATVEGRAEPIESKIYTVEVVDTTAPTISSVYYASEANLGNIFIKLPGMSDISEIDLENSYVKITSTKSSATFKYSKLLANGSTAPDNSYTILEADGTIKYALPHDNVTYTIAYHVEDIYGNEANNSEPIQIKVGDTEKPTLVVADDILKGNYKLAELGKNSPITIDLEKITASDTNKTETTEYDAEYIKENIKIVVKNTTSGKEIGTTTSGKYIYEITETGSYKVTFTLADEAGNVREVSKTFEVEEETTNPMNKEEVIGTVLIIISVLVLAGVVIYFIVSKKKNK